MSFSSFTKDAFCIFSSVPSNTVSGTISVGRGKGKFKSRRFLGYQSSCDLAALEDLRADGSDDRVVLWDPQMYPHRSLLNSPPTTQAASLSDVWFLSLPAPSSQSLS